MAFETFKKTKDLEGHEEAQMIEASAGIPVIYADGACAVEVHGQNARITYFELRTLGGTEVKVPVLEMIRPVRTCGTGELRGMIERVRASGCRRDH